ncbi:MAPEG family protein [Hydrogenophaga sp.]|uniref:MAPEG family protein n=1 Tax=Hydrogenophaga sp. TaxID=1904254 RepID=UPI003F6F3CE0
MTSNPLLYPMAAHVGLTATLYALLTAARAPSVWGVGRAPDGSNPWAGAERRISANLSNQFEWPLFFHVACLLLLQRPLAGQLELSLAWLFVVGRVAHSCIHVFTTNVRLRGIVFTINFLAVLAMWVALLAKSGAP